MVELAQVAQAVAVFSACWAIISGIGAWRREFIGKRQIELAEQTLAKFFEIKDAIAYIRNPFATSQEGKSRARGENEPTKWSDLLDRGYIVVERYSKHEKAFAEFNVLKYKFMASFGAETEEIFVETNKVLNRIFASARMLATHYWRRQGEGETDEFKKHLDKMNRHEGIFWDSYDDDDEIRKRLNEIQERLENATAQCFREPMSTFSIFTKRWLG